MSDAINDFIERVAIQVHAKDSDDFTPKWSKQPGKYRARIRRDVRDVLEALDLLGFNVEKRPRSALNQGASDA